MAATAAAILPLREDPRAGLRIAQNNERRAREERRQTTRSFGDLPALNASLGAPQETPNAANSDTAFRAAQHRERLRRQVGAGVPLYPAPEAAEEGALNDDGESAQGYLRAGQNAYAAAQLGLSGRATSAVRGEVNAMADQAVEQAVKALTKKAQEAASRWAISIGKNAFSITEIPPWAGYLVQALTYLYDCGRAVVTIFVPDATIDISKGASQAVADIGKKSIRTIIPPFSLSEPVGLLGFIFQSLLVLALLAMLMFILMIIAIVVMSAFNMISFVSFGPI